MSLRALGVLALAARCAAYSPGGLLRAPAGWSPAQAAAPAAVRGSAVQMPIGVPKVAYRVPGSSRADWVDIYNRLYRERLIFLGQEIDDEICNQIIAVMLFSDSVRCGPPRAQPMERLAGGHGPERPTPPDRSAARGSRRRRTRARRCSFTSTPPAVRSSPASLCTTRSSTSVPLSSRATSGWPPRWPPSSWGRASAASGSRCPTRA
eukprot:scaffold31507_cov101-Isochrysis_galbana.AAC.5